MSQVKTQSDQVQQAPEPIVELSDEEREVLARIERQGWHAGPKSRPPHLTPPSFIGPRALGW